MSGSTFGKIFKLTSFGESHGPAIGGILEGCPSGLALDVSLIQNALTKRAPGRNSYVSPRKEKDTLEILSGVFEGITTGAPIAFMIRNEGYDSLPYTAVKSIFRPGHAQWTYFKKYGHYDPRGSGRASARETAMRVVAGAIAEQWLSHLGIKVEAFLIKLGPIMAENEDYEESEIFCRDREKDHLMKTYLNELIAEGDSCGGIVQGRIQGLPAGLGNPVFDRFEANLAHAMLSIPATKGFEIGEGMKAADFKGSEFNDGMELKEGAVSFTSSHSGGTLGGITSGDDVVFNVAFKPTSSIKKKQTTLNENLEKVEFCLDPSAKHDPCVAIRGVPVVKAMALCVVADSLLLQRLTRKEYAFEC